MKLFVMIIAASAWGYTCHLMSPDNPSAPVIGVLGAAFGFCFPDAIKQ